MAKRFSRLKYSLRAIQKPGFTAGTDTADKPPAGSIAANFADAKDGGVSYGPRAAESKTGGLIKIAVIPFAIQAAADAAASKKLLVPQSKRAANDATGKLVQGKCNQHDKDVNTTTDSRYTPAKVIVFIAKTAQTDTPEKSKITGINYNPREGNSFTYPYGKVTGKTETEVRAEIRAVATAVMALSYKSEIYVE